MKKILVLFIFGVIWITIANAQAITALVNQQISQHSNQALWDLMQINSLENQINSYNSDYYIQENQVNQFTSELPEASNLDAQTVQPVNPVQSNAVVMP